ncbi:MAG: methyltransferase domain-containing protein [Leadbetterella sp.]|jgi:SAM-dependent methyltransferase|nr:methyltransferase domain-containing protein [Leadbetterella sp.]
MYNSESYKKHQDFIDKGIDENYLEDLFDENSPILHYNRGFFKNIDPIIEEDEKWLTVGDFTGIDAAYIKKKGAYTVASDLSIKTLEEKVLSKGLVDECCIQNVEMLTFENNSFDYVCCKEAYHHFPRPAIGFYEMIRVAKKGVIVMEPNDIGISFPLLAMVRNILDRVNTRLIKKIWKNQYSYEVVGNYVYKVSFREFEKMATGLDLPMIAVKGFNSAIEARWQSKSTQNFKRFINNVLCNLSILPYQHLSIIVFKQQPDDETLKNLKSTNYRLHALPKNPHNGF